MHEIFRSIICESKCGSGFDWSTFTLTAVIFDCRTQTNMASVQSVGKKVNYANLNDLLSVVLYDTGKKPKGKFFPVERIIERRRRGNVSI